jgi:REP element-mobilizing transposase RayT
MPEYRRAFAPGGTFFFTLITSRLRPILATPDALTILKSAISDTKRDRPMAIDAMVVLFDHIHAIWTLPPGDSDFATRWRLIKTRLRVGISSAGVAKRCDEHRKCGRVSAACGNAGSGAHRAG